MLAGAPALLVLDNCEHVIERGRRFLQRTALALRRRRDPGNQPRAARRAGEARLRLRPLAARPSEGARAGETPGVALFVDRVRLADPSFELSAESAELVPKIVLRLDGLPLAIELAAARVESFGMAQLSTLLAAPFRVLTHGARTAPERHRSLRATVDWSYQLMSDPLRRAFRRLAVFPARSRSGPPRRSPGATRNPSVGQLVDCSLLTPPRVGPDGQTRYLMLETVRAFGLEQLDESGERADAEAARVAFAVLVASAAATALRVPGGEAAAAAELDAEEAFMDEALTWALEHDAESALRLAVALAPWWQLRGRARTGYPQLERALTDSGDRADVPAAAHKWLGRLAHSIAEYERALTHFEALCAHIPQGTASPRPRRRAGGPVREPAQPRPAGAGRGCRPRRAPGGTAARLCRGRSARPGPAQPGRGVRRRRGGRHSLGAAGRPDRPVPAAGQGGPSSAAVLTVALADTDDLDAAGATCAAGLESARAAGDVTMQADFLFFTTHIALRAGHLDDAGAHILESLRLTAQSGDLIRVLDCLDDCARLCAATGRPAEAITLWAAHAAGAAALGTPDPRPGREATAASRFSGPSRRLGPQAARAAERRGAQMNLQTAAEFAAMLAGSRHTSRPSGRAG